MDQPDLDKLMTRLEETVKTAVGAATAPLEAKITELTGKADAATAAATAATAQAAELQRAAAETAIVTRLDACVTAGRLKPAERDQELKMAKALPAEIREERLKSIEARTVQLPSRVLLPDMPQPGDEYVDLGPAGAAISSGAQFDERGASLWAAATAKAAERFKGDPKAASDPKNIMAAAREIGPPPLAPFLTN